MKAIDIINNYPSTKECRETIEKAIYICEDFFYGLEWINSKIEKIINNGDSLGTFVLFLNHNHYNVKVSFKGTNRIIGWTFIIEELNIYSFYEKRLPDAFQTFLQEIGKTNKIYNHVNPNEL